MSLHRDDDFGDMDDVVESKVGGSMYGAGDMSSAAQRQRALEQQKARMLAKQQERRGSTSGVVQANRAFTGASRTISSSRARNFSVPKSIDPLEGEDEDEDARPSIKRTGYADSFRGSSRNVSGTYGGVYESLHARTPDVSSSSQQNSFSDPRVANVVSHPNEIEEPTEVKTDQAARTAQPRVHNVESKIEQDLAKRGIPASYDPDEGTTAAPTRKPSLKKKPSESDIVETAVEQKRVSKKESKAPLSESKSADAATAAAAAAGAASAAPALKPKPSKKNILREEEGVSTSAAQDETEADIPSVDEEDSDETAARSNVSKTRASSSASLKKKAITKGGKKSDAIEGKEPEVTNNVREKKAEKAIPEVGKSAAAQESKQARDDSSDDESEIEESAAASSAPVSTYAFDFKDMRAFLMSPIPKKAGIVQCYIERNKSGSNKLFPEYQLFLKDGDRFLMSSKKRAKNRTSNYSVTMDPKDHNKTGGNFIGKLRSNFIGTEFSIFDHGVNPKNADPDSLHVGAALVREELGAVLYASNVLGSRGPRKMRVAIPAINKEGSRVTVRPTKKGEDLLSRFKERSFTSSEIVELINKPPRWNEHVGAYVLNFNGRVTMASVKNFQLVTPEDEDSVVLQFGRVGKDLFTIDVAYPLSPMQAFAITLSSFDSKLACE